MYIEQSFLFSFQITMADLDEFGYWWVYDLTPQQLEKYNGSSKSKNKTSDEEKNKKEEETKTELTAVLSTSDENEKTNKDIQPEETVEEQQERAKLLKLENKAFSINSVWWEKQRRRYKSSSDHRIDMKINPEKDIIEYNSKQSFLTYEALIREISKEKWVISQKEIEKKYLPTAAQLILRLGNPQETYPKWGRRDYGRFYRYTCDFELRGVRSASCWNFPMQEGSVGYYVWLAGGGYAYIWDTSWSWSKGSPLNLVWASALLFKDEQM